MSLSLEDRELSRGPNYEVKLGKTLLGNWVEERKCAHIDQEPADIKGLHVEGHQGILTTEFEAKAAEISTCKESFQNPKKLNIRQKGKKQEMLEKQLYDQISLEVKKELSPPPIKTDYNSTTKTDFTRDFVPVVPELTMQHDLNADQPVTFWNQNMKNIHGISQVRTNDTPFRKNAAFSTPIDEYKDAPKPGEDWNF